MNLPTVLYIPLSPYTIHQRLIPLNQARVLLGNELHGCDDLGARRDIELLNGVAEDRGENREQLRSQLDHCVVLLVVCKTLLVRGMKTSPETLTEASDALKDWSIFFIIFSQWQKVNHDRENIIHRNLVLVSHDHAADTSTSVVKCSGATRLKERLELRQDRVEAGEICGGIG